MSRIKIPYLVCDRRDHKGPRPQFHDATARTVGDIRSAARKQGWTRTWDGRDICPDHRS